MSSNNVILRWKFVSGTNAKSQEVNENFSDIVTAVNNQANALTTVQTNITDLNANKANVNGSSSNTFQVAAGNNLLDAINLQQLKQMMAVAFPLIRGVKITLTGQTIQITSGMAYDNTLTYLMNIQETTITPSSPIGNSTYYIYVDTLPTTLNQVNFTYTQNANGPAVPSGNIWRQIGYFVTDVSGNIQTVTPVGTRVEDVI